MIDLVLSRYGNTECLNRFDIRTAIKLIHQAQEKEVDEWIHRQWCSMLPLMSSKMLDYISFKEYKDRLTGRNIDQRPVEEILAEVNEIRKNFEVK